MNKARLKGFLENYMAYIIYICLEPEKMSKFRQSYKRLFYK